MSTEMACDLGHLMVWGAIRVAKLGIVPEESLFWANVGLSVIPAILADRDCASLGINDLLKLLNDVLGASYSLKKQGLQECLQHFRRTSRDFGQVYGSLRGHWLLPGFAGVLSGLVKEQKKDEAEREIAINRILPLYALSSDRSIPITKVWTVSHSWVHESARTDVWTPINGNEWPVPLPNDTTLEHVRVELLNLGAEYSWLDVLCLRQRGRPEDEKRRKEEWTLDVHTIGYIYSLGLPCITYFNGLGLLFDPSLKILSSDRHWFNRVWTVQEATDKWLPGGLTGVASADALVFFREHLPRSVPAERD
ncbi:uncharacterized protein PHACADRAFT_198168 [Phanerochaete carnosa HHB-10118-sp]|uniref:Heterokaryon incompatibility domain-containing protein n=1 Tax=Phanerochaete carnosa (strain HHB-10118-sp) TaxID=650164 RepID=K5VQK0_PHACS|nr:uncharacterized protein PHACADRAFT_198168 [Phanerochaete carnosa HHB-10118-sp]EKM53748.1 hypothetical protein PHACADRAFT_198168 [Phanerochaete carnosa HHB-10118-sp]